MSIDPVEEIRARFISQADWWIEGQVTGLLAFLGRSSGETTSNDPSAQRNTALRAVRQQLPLPADGHSTSIPSLRLTLPTLHHLYRLTSIVGGWDRENQEYIDQLIDALSLPFEVLSAHDTNRFCTNDFYQVLRSAQHVTDIILYTSVSAGGLLRIVEEFSGSGPDNLELIDDPKLLNQLQELLDVIRPHRLRHSRPADRFFGLPLSYQQLLATVELEGILESRLSNRNPANYATLCVDDIVQCLFQRIFHWVLAVCPSSAAGGEAIGIAQAVTVDVVPGDAQNVRKTDCIGGPRIGLSDWLICRDRGRMPGEPEQSMNTFEYSASVGRLLWERQTSAGRRRDTRSRAVFDFSIADEIAGRAFAALHAPNSVLMFTGTSVEVYLCAAIVNRLSGRESVLNSLATGSLGRVLSQDQVTPKSGDTDLWNQARARGGIDCEVEAVGSIVEKTGCAALLPVYDKLILAGLSQLPEEERAIYDHFQLKSRRHRTLDVVEGHTLSGILSSAVSGYSPMCFIRVPDLLTGFGEVDSDRSRLVQQLIESETSPILNLLEEHSQITGADVFSAVRKIENRHTHAQSLNWSAVRTNVFEEDERFWMTLWDVLCAPYDLYLKLVSSDDPEDAGKLIASAIIGMQGDGTQTERGHDLIVVIGANHLYAERDFTYESRTYQVRRNTYRPLSFEAVYPYLEQELARLGSGRSDEPIGSTRIVLVHEDSPPQLTRPFNESELAAGTDESLVYDAVSSFQYGFTTGQAIRVCARIHWEFRRTPAAVVAALSELQTLGAIARCDTTNEWFVVNHFGKPQLPTETLECSKRLSAIADSLSVPSPQIDTGTEVVESYRPHVVHERQYYGRLSRIWISRPDAFRQHLGSLGIPGYPELPPLSERDRNAGRRRRDPYGSEIGTWRTKGRKLRGAACVVEALNWRSIETAMSYVSPWLDRQVFEGVLQLLTRHDARKPPHPKRAWTLGSAALKYLFRLKRLRDSLPATDDRSEPDWLTSRKTEILAAVAYWMAEVTQHEEYQRNPEWRVSLGVYEQLIQQEAGQCPIWSEACALLEQLQELIDRPSDGFEFIPIGWVDWMGDRVDDLQAAWLYELGVRNNPTWRTAIPKWIGAALLAGEKGAESARTWEQFLEEDRAGRPGPINQVGHTAARRRLIIEDLKPENYVSQTRANAGTSDRVRTRLAIGADHMKKVYKGRDVYYAGMADIVQFALSLGDQHWGRANGARLHH